MIRNSQIEESGWEACVWTCRNGPKLNLCVSYKHLSKVHFGHDIEKSGGYWSLSGCTGNPWMEQLSFLGYHLFMVPIAWAPFQRLIQLIELIGLCHPLKRHETAIWFQSNWNETLPNWRWQQFILTEIAILGISFPLLSALSQPTVWRFRQCLFYWHRISHNSSMGNWPTCSGHMAMSSTNPAIFSFQAWQKIGKNFKMHTYVLKYNTSGPDCCSLKRGIWVNSHCVLRSRGTELKGWKWEWFSHYHFQGSFWEQTVQPFLTAVSQEF